MRAGCSGAACAAQRVLRGRMRAGGYSIAGSTAWLAARHCARVNRITRGVAASSFEVETRAIAVANGAAAPGDGVDCGMPDIQFCNRVRLIYIELVQVVYPLL